jgi:mRNA interferase HigB
MIVIGKEPLDEFKIQYPDSKSPIEALVAELENAEWKTPHDLKARYPKASLTGNQQVIFNICWNKYRLWAQVTYKTAIVLIRAIGTHKEYEKWNIE